MAGIPPVTEELVEWFEADLGMASLKPGFSGYALKQQETVIQIDVPLSCAKRSQQHDILGVIAFVCLKFIKEPRAQKLVSDEKIGSSRGKA